MAYGRKNTALLQSKADQQAKEWLKNLIITENGVPVQRTLKNVQAAVTDGAGGMLVLRVTSTLALAANPGTLSYEDKNYPGRTGWKEIVIRKGDGAEISKATHDSRDISQALTIYPTDPSITPPQDLTASATWSAPAQPYPRPNYSGPTGAVVVPPVSPEVVTPPPPKALAPSLPISRPKGRGRW